MLYGKDTLGSLLLGLVALLMMSGCPGGDVIGEEGGCLEERRCAQDKEQVCGEDGKVYACASMARCEGAIVDPSGQACTLPSTCPDLLCDLACPPGSGFKEDAQGCPTCACEPTACEERDLFDCPPNSRRVCDGLDDRGCETCRCVEEQVMCPTLIPPACGADERLVCSEVRGCQVCECEEEVPVCPMLAPQLMCVDGYVPVCDDGGEGGCPQCECVLPEECPELAPADACPVNKKGLVCDPDAIVACVWQESTRDADWQCVSVVYHPPICPPLAEPDCFDGQEVRCSDLDRDGCEECWCEVLGCPAPDVPDCQGGEVVQRFDASGCANYICEVPLCEPVDCTLDVFCAYGAEISDIGCALCACREEPLSCIRDKDCDQGLSCVFDDLEPSACCLPGEECEDLYPPCVGQCIYP